LGDSIQWYAGYCKHNIQHSETMQFGKFPDKMSSIWLHLSWISGIHKAPGRRRDAVGHREKQDPQRYRILQFVMGYFEMDSVLLTDGNILDSCYKIEGLLR
jgi:hypothetical protein